MAAAPGTRTLRLTLQPGWRITKPTTDYYSVTVSGGKSAAGRDFGLTTP